MAYKFVCNDTTTVATAAGKIRGFLKDTTYVFQGIKYADAKRFQMPTPVKPWDGVKDALSYGYVCPLLSQEKPMGEYMVPHRYWPMDEHCQYLNIWTQSLDASAKKPVMVWLHGGGFSAGSSIEQAAYDGESLSRFGDVVVVSLNHRLNILGYLNLEAYGEKYKNSGNAGNADIVEALRWIRDNIAGFGGDPDNVTIFGQSGGGMKVWTLMQTPEADGLFHKGIIQSGLLDGFMPTKTDGRPIVEALLEALSFDKGDVEKLETVPYDKLAAAYNVVAPQLAAEGEYVGSNPIQNEYYLGDPRVVGFTEHAKTIPVMIGTVMGEFMTFMSDLDKYGATEDDVKAMVEKQYGKDALPAIDMFKKAYPDKYPADLTCLDWAFRTPTIDFIAKKSECPQAPTFSYIFTYEFPVDGDKIPWHCSEIPFVFHNTDLIPVCNIPGVSDRIEERMSSAWVAFARYGNPGIASLPAWPACTHGDEATMIFDKECVVRHNHDHALIETIMATHPVLPFFAPSDDDDEPVILH